MSSTGGSVQSLDRALALLEELAENDRGLTLTELSERTRLHKTTVHRLLATLQDRRFVTRNADTGRYGVGLKVLEIGQAVRRQVAPSALVRRQLTQLRDASGETCHYAVPADGQMVYVEKIESRQTVRIASEVGDHLELYCTALGKAYLAHRLEPEVVAYLSAGPFARKTERTLCSPSELDKAIRRVRNTGYAVDDRENEEEIRCVGAAVRDSNGLAMGAVSLSAPVSRLPLGRVPVVGDLVISCADAIATEMFGIPA